MPPLSRTTTLWRLLILLLSGRLFGGWWLFTRRCFAGQRLSRRRLLAEFLRFLRIAHHRGDGGEFLLAFEVDQLHAHRVPPRGANLRNARANHLAAVGDEHELVGFADGESADDGARF